MKFRFDKHWTSKSGFENIIREGWIYNENNNEISLHDRIKKCCSTIAHWRREENYHTQKILENLKDKFDRSQVDQSLSDAKVYSIQDQLQKAYEEEEAIWQQKKIEISGSKKANVIQNSITQQPSTDVHETMSVV